MIALAHRELLPEPEQVDELIRAEELATLRAAVDRLPDELRKVVLARVYAGAGGCEGEYRQFAPSLGITYQGAHFRYMRAVERLREMLVADEAHGDGLRPGGWKGVGHHGA